MTKENEDLIELKLDGEKPGRLSESGGGLEQRKEWKEKMDEKRGKRGSQRK